MKKKRFIFIFLTIINTMLFGKNMDFNDSNLKNIFTGTEIGEISIQGVVKSLPPIIKYIVYAGNSETDMQSILELPLFVIQTEKNQLNSGFIELPPKVFVKRIGENNTIIPLEEEDNILFKLEVDNYYSDINSEAWLEKGGEIIVTPLGFLSAKDRNSLKRKLSSDTIIKTNGIIESMEQGNYIPATKIKFKTESEGELNVQNQINLEESYGQSLIIQEYFSIEKDISTNTKVLVKIQ